MPIAFRRLVFRLKIFWMFLALSWAQQRCVIEKFKKLNLKSHSRQLQVDWLTWKIITLKKESSMSRKLRNYLIVGLSLQAISILLVIMLAPKYEWILVFAMSLGVLLYTLFSFRKNLIKTSKKDTQ